MSLSIGIDVGGTKIAGGLVDEGGDIVATARRDSPATDPQAMLGEILELVRELSGEQAGDREVVGLGVAAAGFVDRDRATVLFAPNISWRDEPLRAELEAHTDLPVVVENDANAAAWGEFRFGAAHDAPDLLLVTVGTGIGGGLVSPEGHLVRGGFGLAGEVGHQRFERDGRLCGCGNRGCWEPYASGHALIRDVRREAATAPEAKPLVARAGGRPEDIDGRLVTTAAQAGDPFAVRMLATLGQYLGEGLANLAAVLDPGLIVLGGGVSEAGDLLLEPTRTSYAAHLSAASHRPVAEIRRAALGNRAGVIGAADLARIAAR